MIQCQVKPDLLLIRTTMQKAPVARTSTHKLKLRQMNHGTVTFCYIAAADKIVIS